MMKTARIARAQKMIVALVAVVLAWPMAGTAGIFSAFAREYGSDSLLVTGNYLRPRLLAEWVQRRTGAAILLVDQNGADRVFYISVDAEKPLELEAGSTAEFVKQRNPRRVVILGNDSVVPPRISMVLEDRFPTSTAKIARQDWDLNATAVANLFEYNRLPAVYAKQLEKERNRPAETEPEKESVVTAPEPLPPGSGEWELYVPVAREGEFAPLDPDSLKTAPVIEPID